MAFTVLTVFNLALNSIGTRDDVSDPDEESREAEVCRLWFGPTRDQVLRAAPWASAKAFARLAVLAERDETVAWGVNDPSPGYRFAYALPADAIAPRFLSTFGRFELGMWGSTPAIMAQEEQTILAYTKRQDNPALWDSQLQMAIAHALAAFIAMPLHGKPQRARLAQDTANSLIMDARVSNANADDNQYDSVPDWIQARGYAGSAPTTRFIYPYGPMISVSELAGVQ